ncbi:protein FAM24A-like [Mus caroli]|uniref:Protein FAM24A-like n=1 Tax=Mus caroli TaxID=10089 RepID=A0A6P5QB17_MUSCR|nr:protein FAM24A-like [Mus caroli]XP_021024453.1 protein FAM24A-like [Mus caroli]XP_021024454.1 protein FAM24A-like [Mus caroli]XP_021024455.1 protein FAM24A-like [Mus caroli]
MYKPFDLRTIITIIIGCGILTAMFLLIGLVLCLYSKISKALKSPGTTKEADDECYIDPCKDPQESIILANSIPAEACHSYQANTIAVASCGPLQCCNVCGVYADVNSLPPCLCSIREGL